MFTVDKRIRKICMVSSAAFSAASGCYGWLAPVGAALGFAVDISKEKVSTHEEFDEAVMAALNRTEEKLGSKGRIIEELGEWEWVSEPLDKLIEKTDYFQSQYCTNADTREIVEIFEKYFKEEIINRPSLSNLYMLSMESAALEKLEKIKLIVNILGENRIKLEDIQKELRNTDKKITLMHQIYMKYIRSIVFIIVAMVIFWGRGLLLNHTYDRMMIVIVPFCYIIAESIIFILSIDGNVIISGYKYIKNRDKYHNSKILMNGFVTYVIHMISSMFFFSLFYFTLNIDDNFMFSALSLALGSFASVFLREILG